MLIVIIIAHAAADPFHPVQQLVFFWLYHVPSCYGETRSWVATAAVLGFLLLPHLVVDSSSAGLTTVLVPAC